MLERHQVKLRHLAAALLLLGIANCAPADERRSSLSEFDFDDFFDKARKLLRELHDNDEAASHTGRRYEGASDTDRKVQVKEAEEEEEIKKKIKEILGKKEDDEWISEDRRRAASYIETSDGEHHKKANFKPNPDENEVERMIQGIQRKMTETSTSDEIVHAVAQAMAKLGRPLGDGVSLDMNGRSMIRGVSMDKRLSFMGDLSRRWQDGIIVYEFNSTVPYKLSTYSETNVRLAIKYLESVTCLTFVEYYNGYKEDYGLTHDSVIQFGDFGGCWSYVGPIYQRQEVSPCGEDGISTPLHEILHALAAWHEQNRADRDQWIEIMPHVRRDVNYDKMDTDDRVPYDYGSVMQYSLGSEMNIFDRKMEFLVGRRFTALAHLDIESININYKCIERKCPTFSVDCKNEGFPAYINKQCQCRCPHGFMGDDCSQLYKPADLPTEWPSGEYATLRPEIGCPSGFASGDRPMTTAWYSFWSSVNHWPEGTRGKTYTNYPFCTTDGPISSSYNWPAGSYCIYRKGGSCPAGFKMGSVQFDEESNSAESVSGSLPDGVYDANTLLYYCCREDAPSSIPIKLPLTTPFYLLRDATAGACQTVEGAAAVEEYVATKIADEGIVKSVEPNSMQPFYFVVHLSLLSDQCYYIPQNYECGGMWKLDGETSEVTLTSPNYPNPYGINMECFYSITSTEGTKIKIEVIDLDLEATSEECKDDLEIRHNHISQPSERYCGDYYRGIFLTNYNSTFLVFRSDEVQTVNKGFSIKVSIVYGSQMLYYLTDRGTSYHGDVNYTQSHEMCKSWTDAADADCLVSPWKGSLSVGFDNKCRNPNAAEQPWCYIDLSNCDTDYCDVSGLTTCFDARAGCADLISNDADFCSKNYAEAFKNCHKSCGFCGFQVSTPVLCSLPPTIQHADLVDGESIFYNVGDKVTYQCRDNFGYQVRTCLTDGTWSGVDRMCGSCPLGWSGRGSSCYGYFSTPEIYSNAQSICAAVGGTLVSFSDAEEEAFVSNYNTDLYWIGLNDLEEDGKFVWADGSPYGSYTNWANNEPSDADCVYVASTGARKWVATYPDFPKPFVCERTLNGNLCSDARSDCTKVLADFPDMCSRVQFASTMCRRTCGQCPLGSVDIPDPNSAEEVTLSTNAVETTSSSAGKAMTPSIAVSTSEEKSPSTPHPSEGTAESTDIDIGPTETTFTPLCREGYNFYDGSCYTVATIDKNFDDAVSFCNGTGGFLVSIGSEEELEFVRSILPYFVDDVAIGLHDTEDEGTFVLVENGEEPSFTDWGNRQPKTRNGFDCVYLSYAVDYTYRTLKCDVQTPFVCEYRPQENIQYVGSLPVNDSISYTDFYFDNSFYIFRPLETLPGGRLVGFHVYSARRGDVILTILRPTNVVDDVIDTVRVVDYVEVTLEERDYMMYVESHTEILVESGDVVGFYFPKKNPVAYRPSFCEFGPVLRASKPDLDEEISPADEGFCEDYYIQAIVNTGPHEKNVSSAQGTATTPSTVVSTSEGTAESTDIDIGPTETAFTPLCREGYSFYDGSCYTVVTIDKNFDDAVSFCTGTGGFLVSIGSEEELEFVRSILPYYVDDVAIGLHDTEDEGTFILVENGEEPSFTDWASRQPKTRNGFDCVYLSYAVDFSYRTLKCDVQTPFVCEYRPQENIQYVGSLPVNDSISYTDYYFDKSFYIFRPLETLPGGRLVGFHVYSARRGDVILTILRPTNVVDDVIDTVRVVDYVEVTLEERDYMMYVEPHTEILTEPGDVVGFYFPKKNPVAYRPGFCEFGPLLRASKPDLEEEISPADEGFCEDYYIQAVVNTGPHERSVDSPQGKHEKKSEASILAELQELTKELQLLEG